MKQWAPYGWLINHLNYVQTYLLIFSIFALSLLPLIYYWVSNQTHQIKELDAQIRKIQQEENLKQVIEHFQKERALTQRLLIGNKNLKSDLEILQSQTAELLQEAIDEQKAVSSISEFENEIEFHLNPQLLQSRWAAIRKKSADLTIEENENLYTTVINHALIQLSYLNNLTEISNSKHFSSYILLTNIKRRVPPLEEFMDELFLIIERVLNENTITPVSRTQIEDAINNIQVHLPYLTMPDSEQANRTDMELNRLLANYIESTNNLITTIQNQILNSKAINILPIQFISLSETNSGLGSQLWAQALTDLRRIFVEEHQIEQRKLWFPLLTSLLLALIASQLGLGIAKNISDRLNANTHATDSLADGNFSVRVPNAYRDETGKQSDAFNRMAHKVQELISQLNELIEAITTLSNGNLGARIKGRANQTEVNQVAVAFNKMAETFERIITRLHQVGITLTTSATEIAVASREQETITVEQEASTREIAVAANEISSTAREFASTMHDVGLAAEQTSNLALKGKESLTNMEGIMRHMVDASTTIASKLGVLNERAGNITSVITTITKVAGQTNLLSLNASIEAEKAGEYGRSFAVIAREIRRLADQTAIATLDIEKIVNEIMTAVSSSVMGVDDFTQEIRRGVDQVRSVSGQLAIIIEQVQEFIARFELVNQGMQTQSTGAEQINEAISQLSQSAQQTTESIHHFHNTIEELNRAANELHNLISFISPRSIEEKEEENLSSFEQPQRAPRTDAARQFKRTLSNLSDTSQRLRNLHSLLKSPVRKEDEDQNETSEQT